MPPQPIHSLPFRAGPVDVVLFVTTLEFLEDPAAALAEAARVARRGLVPGVLNRWSLASLRRLLCRRSVRAAGRLMRPGELHRLVRRALGHQLGPLTFRIGAGPPGGRWLTRWAGVGEFMAMGVRLRR